MQILVDNLAVALRVLTALTMKEPLDPRDAAELRALLPLRADMVPLDELACEVIQLALKRLRGDRAMGASA
jgi:hypothetical protein